MGLLDDAIREHLDLKRRRGADPTEIERAEREALGPVRRAPEELVPEGYGAEGYAPEGYAPEGYAPEAESLPPESWIGADAGAAPGPIELEPAAHEPFDEFEPYGDPEAEAAHGGQPAPQADRSDERQPAPRGPIAPDEAPTGEHHHDQATVEHHLDEPAPPAGEEDVLEETPEFLQDTPEHDRLWFEQRPPRDFDFNE